MLVAGQVSRPADSWAGERERERDTRDHKGRRQRGLFFGFCRRRSIEEFATQDLASRGAKHNTQDPQVSIVWGLGLGLAHYSLGACQGHCPRHGMSASVYGVGEIAHSQAAGTHLGGLGRLPLVPQEVREVKHKLSSLALNYL